MSTDPQTGLVDQAYRHVTAQEYADWITAHDATLSAVHDDRMQLDGYHDASKPWPEGLQAFISRATGMAYVRDDGEATP